MQDSTCSIAGCETGIRARGYCASHYARWNRYGNPLHVTPRQAKIDAILDAGEVDCTQCGRRRALSEFNRDSRRPTGRRRTCKECASSATRRWIEENPAKVNATSVAYRIKNAESRREYSAAYLPEWKRENAHKIRDYTYRRRAKKANTETAPIDYSALWETCGGACSLCGHPLDLATEWPSPRFASIDHIVPLSRGGGHVQSNLQYACLDCNVRKGAKAV